MEVATNWWEHLPPGFKFQPSHEQAIECYLKPEVLGYRDDRVPDGMIPEVDMLAFEPWELATVLWEQPTANNQDKECWFFYQQTEARRGSVDRSTQSGYWKKTGKDSMIKDRNSDTVIGSKKIVTFYRRYPKDTQTNWVIHEYHAHVTEPPMRRNLVLCSLKQKQQRKGNFSEEQEQGQGDLFSELFRPLRQSENVVSLDLHQPSEERQQGATFFGRFRPLRQSENVVSLDLLQPSEGRQQGASFSELFGHPRRSENVVSFDLHQPSFRSENSSGSDLQSSMGISLDDDFPFIDESNELEFLHGNTQEFTDTDFIDFDDFDGDQMQMECGQTSSLCTEQVVLRESQRAQTTGTIRGEIPLDVKKGFVQSKVKNGHASSTKPMVPQEEPAANDARLTERDARNITKHELAARRTKLERVSLDESSAKAKMVEVNGQRGATIPSQKKSMKEIGQDGVLPKTKKKSTCKDTEISPSYSLVHLRNAGIGIVLLIAIALRALYF